MPINFTNRHKFNKITSALPVKIFSAVFLISLSYAIYDTVWSIFIDSFLNNASLVGFFSGILTIVSVLCYFFFTPVLERYPKKKTWMLGALGLVVGYMLFFLANSFKIVVVASLIYVVSRVLHYESQGIIICDSCKKKELGKTEGVLYVMRNLGWLIGPLIGGFVAARIGISYVFLFSALFVIIGIVIFNSSKIKNIDHKTKDKGTFISSFRNLKSFFKNKKRFMIYIISGGTSLYWGIIYIYAPLYIIRNGLPSYFIGLFLFAVVIPLVIFEYPMGKYADRRGYRRLFIFGHLILAIFCFLSFISGNVYYSLFFLALGSIGASFLESSRESYFFKIVKKANEEKYYGPYMTHQDAFGSLGKILGAVLLIFFPLHTVFLLLSFEMLIFAAISTGIKE